MIGDQTDLSASEKRLVKRLQKRDEKAFNHFVRLFQDKVYSLAFRMLGSQAEAEDVAQEVFISIFQKIDSFRGDSSLSTWVYRITINHCHNRHKYLSRRHSDQTQSIEETGDRERLPDSDAPQVRPDHGLERKDREACLERALASLDEEAREIILLRDIHQLSYQEICQVLQLPIGTVKSRLHRARSSLKDTLKPHLELLT